MNHNNPGKGHIQDLSCCGLAIIAGMGVYLGLANHLGVSKLPALLGSLALIVPVLFLYRLLLTKAARQAGRLLLALQLLAAAVIIALNISGVIHLWAAFELSQTPFLVYVLLTSVLLALVAWRGERAVLRSGPLVCLILITAIIFDTVFIAPKINVAYLWQYPWKAAGDIAAGGAEITVALLAPGMLFLLCYFLHRGQGGGEPVFPRRSLARGLIFPLLYLILELLREIMVFGDLTALDDYPILRTLKSVYFGIGVSRLEFLEIMALCSAIFIGIMLEFTVMLKLTERILAGGQGKKNRGANPATAEDKSAGQAESGKESGGGGGGSDARQKWLLAGQIILIILICLLMNAFWGSKVWLLAEAAAILVLLAYPLCTLAKKSPGRGAKQSGGRRQTD